MKDYDVAIVGGGLLGSAFGWGLANLGVKSVVFDEGDNAIRTARGNFGLVWVQGKGLGMPEYVRWSLRASRQWTEFSDQLQDETGIGVRYHRPGGFIICTDDDEFHETVDLLQRLREESGDNGYNFETVDHAALKKQIPTVGDVPGATYCPHDGHCDPLRLLRALHKGYLDKGGDYCPQTHIDRATREGGQFQLFREDGSMAATAAKIIVSAGHGSKKLGEQVGLDVPIYPDQGQVLVTEKVKPSLNFPTVGVRQTDDGSFMLGASSREGDFDLGTDNTTLKDIAQRCTRAFPMLRNLRIQRVWAALRVMTPDGFPVYQQSSSHPGAFSFACHSGVTLAANHALDVSRWVKDGAIPDEFNGFHPDRFDVQALRANQ